MSCHSSPKILVVDYVSLNTHGLAFELCTASPSTRPPVLKLFAGNENRSVNRLLRCALSSPPALAMQTFLRAFSHLRISKDTTVVFGARHDPLSPLIERLPGTLGVLELLAAEGFGRVILQTRSPLALLAAPLFKSLGERGQINMGIETTNDDLAARVTPHLPKPTERIAALQALQATGIPTSFQTAPIICREHGQNELPELGRFILNTPCAVHVVDPTRILSGRGAQASVAERRLVKFMRADGHRLLQNETLRLEHADERDGVKAA
ncbi:MAG: hypothetical protein U0136_01895 [Bdellovibrionota bacterium]